MNSYTNTLQHVTTRYNTLFKTFLLLPMLLYFLTFLRAQTLCSQYGNNTPNYTVGAGTAYPYSSNLPSTAISGATLYVVGDFIVNNGFILTNSIVKVNPNVKITVATDLVYYQSNYLSLNNTKIFACSGLWKGIELQSITSIGISNSIIEDAEDAIKSFYTGLVGLSIDNTTFNRNKIAINIEDGGPSGWYYYPPMLSYFVNNKFTCTSPLNNSSWSEVGLRCKGNPYLAAFCYANTNNSFTDINNGIQITASYAKFTVDNYIFTNIRNVALDFDGGDQLNINNSIFNINNTYSLQYGDVRFQNARVLKVDNCIFNTTPAGTNGTNCYNIGVFTPLVDNNIEIKNSNFNLNGAAPGQFRCIGIGVVQGYNIPNPTLVYNTNIHNNNFQLNIPGNGSGGLVFGIDLNGNNASNSSNLIDYNFFNTNNSGSANPTLDRQYSSSIVVGGAKHNTKIRNNTQIAGYSTFCNFNGSGIGNEIIGNIINQGANNRTGYFITTSNSENLKICSNTDNSASKSSYYFIGNNMGMNFTSNITYGSAQDINYSSLYIYSNSVIGYQYQKGNKWFSANCYPTGGICHPRIKHADPSVAFLSKFTVHTPQSTLNTNGQYSYFSAYYPANVSPQTSNFFTFEAGSPENPCVLPQIINGGNSVNYQSSITDSKVLNNDVLTNSGVEPQGEDPINDPLIAKNGLADYFKSSARQFDFRMHLYRKIKTNPTAYLSKDIYINFIKKYEKDNIGKLFDLEQKMSDAEVIDANIASDIIALREKHSLLDEDIKKYDLKNKPTKDDKERYFKQKDLLNKELDKAYQKNSNNKKIKYKEAKNTISSFFPLNAHQSLIKQLYDIYLDVQLNQEGAFTKEQYEQIKKIASTCITEGGQIVLIARSFLTPQDLLEVENLMKECEPNLTSQLNVMDVNSFALASPKNETHLKPEFIIYPNPTKESFSIDILEGQVANMQITDLTGKIVSIYQLKNGVNNINHNLQNGIYIINIKTDSGKMSSQKLIVRN